MLCNGPKKGKGRVVVLRRSCSLSISSMSVQDGMSRDGALFRRHNVKIRCQEIQAMSNEEEYVIGFALRLARVP